MIALIGIFIIVYLLVGFSIVEDYKAFNSYFVNGYFLNEKNKYWYNATICAIFWPAAWPAILIGWIQDI